MKKILLVLLTLAVSVGASARDKDTDAGKKSRSSALSCHLGLQGGLTVNKFDTWEALKNAGVIGWHAGATMLVKMPLFFAVQPSVLYEQQNSGITYKGDDPQYTKARSHNINVPIEVQWGPDLGVCRPFVMVVPTFDFTIGAQYYENDSWNDMKDKVNPFQFGLGLGAGIDIWRMQLSARYNWAFDSWAKTESVIDFFDFGSKKQSITVSLVFFFK